jgi:hypothetical protein
MKLLVVEDATKIADAFPWRAEIDAVLDYNIAQHKLIAAMRHPATK